MSRLQQRHLQQYPTPTGFACLCFLPLHSAQIVQAPRGTVQEEGRRSKHWGGGSKAGRPQTKIWNGNTLLTSELGYDYVVDSMDIHASSLTQHPGLPVSTSRQASAAKHTLAPQWPPSFSRGWMLRHPSVRPSLQTSHRHSRWSEHQWARLHHRGSWTERQSLPQLLCNQTHPTHPLYLQIAQQMNKTSTQV